MQNKVTIKIPGELYRRLSQMIADTGFLKEKRNQLVIISDHGFCSFGEAKVQSLPLKSEWGELKGDHHQNALLITLNLDYEIDRPQDVFFALKTEFKVD